MTIDDDLRGDVIPWTDAGATRGDLTIFHFALVSPMTAEFARLTLGPRAAVSQRHAGAFFCRLRRGDLPPGDARPRGPEEPGRSYRHRARRLGIQPAGAGGRSASPIPACFRSRSIPSASPTRRGGRHSKKCCSEEGWPNFLFVGPHRPQQEDRRSHQARRALQALRRRAVPVRVRRQDRRDAAVLRRRSAR